MTFEAILNSANDAQELAKDIARNGKIVTIVIRDGNKFIVKAKNNVDISSFIIDFHKKRAVQESLDSHLNKIAEQKSQKENLAAEASGAKKFLADAQTELIKIKNLSFERSEKIESLVANLIASKEITLCSCCSGNGHTKTSCNTCNGEGVIKKNEMKFNLCKACGGDGGISGNCYSCSGTGYKDDVYYQSCDKCHGDGAFVGTCDVCGNLGFLGNPALINFTKNLSEIQGINLMNLILKNDP